MNPFAQQILIQLLMRGGLPPSAATPGFVGPSADTPTTTLPPVRPGFRDIWRGIGSRYQGVDIPAEEARTHRNRALGDVGIGLLSTAGKAPLHEAFPRALSAFRGGVERESSSFLERRRQTEKDELERRTRDEQISSSRAATRRQEAEEGRKVKEYDYTEKSREGARETARDLVREVEEIAGKDSNEADRARALAKGGPPLLKDLQDLHEAVLARQQEPERAKEKTDIEIERSRRIYKEDPSAVFDRRMEERRAAAYERQLSQYGGGAQRITPQQFNDDVRAEAAQIYDTIIDEEKARIEEESLTMISPKPIDYRAARERANKEAEEAVKRRYDLFRATPLGEEGAPPPIDEELLPVAVDAIVKRLPPEIRADPSVMRAIQAGLAAGKNPEQVLQDILEHARRKGAL